MEFRGAGGYQAPIVSDVRAAAPIRICRPRACQSGQECGEVPNLQERVAHNVGEAAAQKHIAVAIAPSARDCRFVFECPPLFAPAQVGAIAAVGSEQCHSLGRFAVGDAHGFAVEKARFAIADDALFQYGLVDCPENRSASILQADECPEKRNFRDEGFSPVDWIEHPYELGGFVDVAELLADDSVFGKFFRDFFAQHKLCIAVYLGYGRMVFFEVDADVFAERPRNVFAAYVGKFVNKNLEIFNIHIRNTRTEL